MFRLGVILVAAAHFAFIATAVLGGFFSLWRPRWAWIQVPVVLWAGFIAIVPWTCPLTALELWLRGRGGMAQYSGGFMVHYIHPVLTAIGLGPIIPWLGFVVLGLNTCIYGWIFLRYRKRRRAAILAA